MCFQQAAIIWTAYRLCDGFPVCVWIANGYIYGVHIDYVLLTGSSCMYIMWNMYLRMGFFRKCWLWIMCSDRLLSYALHIGYVAHENRSGF